MLTFIVVASVVWFVILFLDTIFKSCFFHPYLSALQTNGIDVRPLYISVSVTRFNRWINQIGRYRSKFLKTWFNVGACVTSVIFFPSIVLYFVSLYQMAKTTSANGSSEPLLMPVIPGYNVPSSHFIYYVVIVLFCSAVHEFGHALAASRERVCIENFGFAVFGIFSLAFVNLRSDQMKQLSHWEKLRILCAGIWHNIVLALITLLFWYLIFIILSPVYSIGSGVSILKIHELSGLNHPSGFEVGDHVYGIGDCEVLNTESWQSCIQQLRDNPQQGFCIPNKLSDSKDYIMNNGLCVNSSEYLSFHPKSMNKVFCLKAREAINFASCNEPYDCKNDFQCAVPVIPEFHRFVAIKRHYKPQVLYDGTMAELCSDVEVSNFVPKYSILPASFAECLIFFLQYIIMFSSGLAILNVLPIFFHDGTYIVENFIHMCFENYIPSYNKRNYIVTMINRVGIIMLAGLILSFFKHYIFS